MRIHCRSLALALILVAPGMALADYTGIGPALPYNDYVLGNFTQSGTDAGSSGTNNGMGVAVGGNFAPSGGGTFTVNGNIVVGGSYTNSGAQIGGNIYGYGNVTFSNETVNGSVYSGNNLTISGGGEPSGGEYYVGSANIPGYFTNAHQISSLPTAAQPVNFTTGNAYLISEATTLDNAASTTGVSVTTSGSNHIVTLSGTGSNFYDFKVNASDFSAANSLNINVTGKNGATPTVVVDVVNGNGTTAVSFPNIAVSYSGTLTNQYVLYNFAGSSPLDTNNAAIEGAVLAPNSAVNFNGGHIDGTMIAGSLSGQGESHAYAFLGNSNLISPSVVPEPASILLMGVGVLGVAITQRRKQAARSIS